MKTCYILVGPPGSGKSTYAKELEKESNHVRVNQDDHGKQGHMEAFQNAIKLEADIIVDRMNFDKAQRRRYLDVATKNNYVTKIVVFHESYDTCMTRMKVRQDHPTIKDETSASKALNFFFSHYERPDDTEADEVVRIWPDGDKPKAIICDLDGTLCNVEHRRHFVRREGKKDWKSFFDGISEDTPNLWCVDLLRSLWDMYEVVYCSGRSDDYRKVTKDWLEKYGLCRQYDLIHNRYNDLDLYMRNRHDHRQDSIVKEIILDFEILTRYTPYFMIDDRRQVVDMWRKRGYVCLHCDDGEF